MSKGGCVQALGFALACVSVPASGAPFGSYTYHSADACIAAGKLPRDVCANAARNAAAEFQEKAPHFATRGACEQAFRAGCSLSFRQGAHGIVSFTPRQAGFRIMVRSDRDIVTTPVARGFAFSQRTALHNATSINPRAAGAASRGGGAGAAAAVYGASTPDGEKGPLPPPVPYDPNFDCSKYVDPAPKGSGDIGCIPVPNYHR